jgi:hypothetical protein
VSEFSKSYMAALAQYHFDQGIQLSPEEIRAHVAEVERKLKVNFPSATDDWVVELAEVDVADIHTERRH